MFEFDRKPMAEKALQSNSNLKRKVKSVETYSRTQSRNSKSNTKSKDNVEHKVET